MQNEVDLHSSYLNPPMPPVPVYNLFYQVQRAELLGEPMKISERKKVSTTKRKHRKSHGKLGFKELSKLISMRWKRTSTGEKKLYKDIYQRNMLAYRKELESYKNRKEIRQMQSTLTKKSTTMTKDWDHRAVKIQSLSHILHTNSSHDFDLLREASTFHKYQHRNKYAPIDPYSLDEMVKRSIAELESALRLALIQTRLFYELNETKESI